MKNSQPIFEAVFGEQWKHLPSVMHKHYANRPYSNDVVTVEGKMDVEFGWLIILISPLLRIFGALVPYQGHDIPVTVHFKSELDSEAYCLHRIFNFPGKRPYIFKSKMVRIKDNTIVELMRFGLGWRHQYHFDGQKVRLLHGGYVWKIFGRIVPMPMGLLLGRVTAEEEAIDDETFRMKMTLRHLLFGKMYEYRGVFKVVA